MKNFNGEIVFSLEYDKETLRDMVIEKQEEIDRLNKEIKEYQEELAKADSITKSCIFEGKEEATMSFRECLNHLERLHSIIKEVRDTIEDCVDNYNSFGDYEIHWECKSELLEILDKEKV